MKKIILIVLVIVISVVISKKTNAEETIIIPDSAIRLRVIANSNTVNDQHMKNLIKNSLEQELFNKLKDITEIDKARGIVKDNISNIESNIKNIFQVNNYNQTFEVDFGYNHFPKKEFKGITYNEGNYESLVVTIGSGDGNNFWCVLFPPLCMMETDEVSNMEYKFFVKEWIDKIFKN